jgi:cytochrome c oxidase subunit II
LVPLALAVATTSAAGCELPGFGAPSPKSEEGETIYSLWQGFFIAALVVAGLVWGLLLFVILRYRRRRDDDMPDQTAYHIPLEIVYTLVPIVVVAGLFTASVIGQRDVNEVGSDDGAVAVDVIGFQWSWQFHYRDEGVLITGVPGRGPELVLPVGQPSHLRLVTADVNHAFWVPDFLSKRDLIPEIDNEIEITPTETGNYAGRCAEFCGLDHWRMNYSVRVVSQDEFDAWVQEQKDAQARAGEPELKVEIDEDGDLGRRRA